MIIFLYFLYQESRPRCTFATLNNALIVIRARAGNLQGPYCFSKDSLFLGPGQGTCKDPIVFKMILYSSLFIYFFFFSDKMIVFSQPGHIP